jgi:hypothetical protein
VGRVRHELALGAHRALERVEHLVEAPGQARDLVAAARVDALPHVLRLGDVLGRPSQAAERLDGTTRHQAAEDRREGHAAERDDEQDHADAAQHRVHLGQRARDLDGAAAGQRRDEHAQLLAADARVTQEGPAPAGRHLARALVHGERVRGAERGRRAVGQQDLLEEVEAAPVARRREAPAPRPRPARAAEDAESLGELAPACHQRVVDPRAQLVADRKVGERRREQYRDRDRGAGEQREAAAEGHGSVRRT